MKIDENLLITPNHPIKYRGKWVRPKDLNKDLADYTFINEVYNFVLDSCHIVTINGI